VLKQYRQSRQESARLSAKHYDPFLTAFAEAHLQVRPAAITAREERNASLRDQFNAARLKLGMTRAEVAAVLRARPLDSGKVETGAFEIYGATVSLGIWSPLHYHNIVALYRGDRLTGIYSGSFAQGGRDGFDRLRNPCGELRESLTGLPPAALRPD
jgi:hypothetical protein